MADGQDIRLRSPELLHLEDANGNRSHGFNQEWYGSEWQRRAGCGPCVAANLLLYLHRTRRLVLPFTLDNRTDLLAFMEAVWVHVTPTAMGLHTLKRFCGGVHAFLYAHAVPLDCRTFGVSRRRGARPPFEALAGFIAEGLRSDGPVAFLNLSNGTVRNLEPWHWVTLVAIGDDPSADAFPAEIYDGEQAIRVDLRQWYNTTTLGGGFLYLAGGSGGPGCTAG